MQFKNPPIVEAVIGFTIAQLPEAILEDFHRASDRLAEMGYTEAKRRQHQNVTFSVVEGDVHTEMMQLGWQFQSQQKPFTVQFLRTGFLFSQTGSYTSWEDFTRDARDLWQMYIDLTGLTEVQMYQVRYINKLFIPEGVDWSEYVTVYPFLPPEIPQGVNEYFCRLVMPMKDPLGPRLVHQQALLPPEKMGFVSFLLDNDFQFSALGIAVSELWTKVDEVRDIKDWYFEVFTTKKSKECFDA
jgi:uncharacterized protein (TIGR04255 family)